MGCRYTQLNTALPVGHYVIHAHYPPSMTAGLTPAEPLPHTGNAVSYFTSRSTTLLLTLATPVWRKSFSCRKRS